MQDTPKKTSGFSNPWLQLVFGVICMAMVANLQYGWPQFINPINDKFNWGLAPIKVISTIFIVTQTWVVPAQGYLVDRYSSRPVLVTSGVLCLLAWVLNGIAESIGTYYLAAAIGGIGVGGVYGSIIGRTIRWFPNNRGLALGIVTASYGVATAVTVAPIGGLIKTQGFESVFIWLGVAQGLIVILLGLIMTAPPRHLVETKSPVENATSYSARPMEVLREPVFWIMYLMFTLMVAGGLMATAQLAPIAKTHGLEASVLVMVLSLDRILNNGVTRPLFGWISDRIGRENTMFAAFALEALAILLMSILGGEPSLFIALGCLIVFAWGAAYSLFPASAGDSFGTQFAATNSGMLYTAKGAAAFLVPVGVTLSAATGSWEAPFYLAAIMAAVSAVLALWVLKPMRKELCLRYDAQHEARQRAEALT